MSLSCYAALLRNTKPVALLPERFLQHKQAATGTRNHNVSAVIINTCAPVIPQVSPDSKPRKQLLRVKIHLLMQLMDLLFGMFDRVLVLPLYNSDNVELSGFGDLFQDKVLNKSRQSPQPFVCDLYLLQKLLAGIWQELLDQLGAPEKTVREVIDHLVKQRGTIVKVKDGFYFHKTAIDAIRGKLVENIRALGRVTTAQIKDLWGVSRKFLIPLCEYFDGTKVTMRVGETRVLRGQATQPPQGAAS
jgi:hypothetical protein